MDTLFPEDLYHSYIIEGDPSSSAADLKVYLEERPDVGLHNPDFLFQIYESFTSNDVASIKEWHNKRGIGELRRVCIIATKFINHEAEQALLKILEEPKEKTHFFLVVPNASLLLDTIKSRTHLVRFTQNNDSEFKKIAETIMASTLSERLSIVADIIEQYKDGETSGKIRFVVTSLVNELEKCVYVKFKKDPLNEEARSILSELQNARMYVSTPGASVKMILEHIALVI